MLLSVAVFLATVFLAAAPAVATRRAERQRVVVAAMRPVARPAPVYALLTREPMAAGSRISLLCGWSEGVAQTRWRLRLTVTTGDRRSVLVAEWTATADTVQPMSAWTDLEPSRIAGVEVSTAAGARLLTFPP